MARTSARLPLSMLREEATRSLSPRAFLLYVLLLLQPDLKPCGVLTRAENRWTSHLAGLTLAGTQKAFAELITAGWAVVDETTDEVWLPRFVVDDNVIGHVASAFNALRTGEQVISAPIRLMMQDRQVPLLAGPAASAYRGGASNGSGRRRTATDDSILTGNQPAVDSAVSGVARQPAGLGAGVGVGASSKSSRSKISGVSNAGSATRKRTGPCPEPFPITDMLRTWASDHAPGVDLVRESEILVDWARSKGERRVEWVRTWKNWMRRAAQESGRAPRRLRTVRDEPPSMATYQQTNEEMDFIIAENARRRAAGEPEWRASNEWRMGQPMRNWDDP